MYIYISLSPSPLLPLPPLLSPQPAYGRQQQQQRSSVRARDGHGTSSLPRRRPGRRPLLLPLVLLPRRSAAATARGSTLFFFCLPDHQSLSRLLPLPPPPPHFPVLLLGRQPAAATGWVDVDAAWPPQGISSPCTARVTFTTASYRYRGQGGLGRRAAN